MQVILEKTSGYLYSLDAPKRVREMDPFMKLIVIVRNPLDRIMSKHLRSSRKGRREEDADFEDLFIMEDVSFISQ